ncbi:uncharacterized protein LOC113208553 isoform X2 [Frankliniella occidentalis]|uniref:Uncharacterized protein LOC113208553 isoform X2 n=1 Tax=Frankliniella occidentalis TaxID=133901 RepID=A0A9C6X916_FRAOC|nr:uncharacterized protein LOC113208553 isoform X2 [Frankliniella occidentalis]
MTTKPSHVSNGAATAMDERGQMTLLLLPDVPLLRVLSLLSIKDLGSAGLAAARLGALTRAHSQLWRGEDLFESVEDVLALLPVAPPVDALEFSEVWWTLCDVSRVLIEGVGGLKLKVEVGRGWGDNRIELWTRSLIVDLVRQLRHLQVVDIQLGWLFGILQDATCLETLSVQDWWIGSQFIAAYIDSVCWPQSVVLPRLHSLCVMEVDRLNRDYKLDVQYSLWAFDSLLRAHGGQIRCLALLGSRELVSLVDSCTSNVVRMDLVADLDMISKLRRIWGLKELAIETGAPAPYARQGTNEEVENVLRSLPGPLRRLELAGWRDKTLEALAAGKLTDVQDLVLLSSVHAGHLSCLGSCLARLPRLRSLAVFDKLPAVEVLRGLTPATIPTLELLVVAEYQPKRDSDEGRSGATWGSEEVTQLVAVLQDLVRRAPTSLHVVLRLELCDCEGEEPGSEALRGRLFFRHPEGETDCPLCADAAEAAGLRTFYSTRFPLTYVERVQVL